MVNGYTNDLSCISKRDKFIIITLSAASLFMAIHLFVMPFIMDDLETPQRTKLLQEFADKECNTMTFSEKGAICPNGKTWNEMINPKTIVGVDSSQKFIKLNFGDGSQYQTNCLSNLYPQHLDNNGIFTCGDGRIIEAIHP